jgi:fatty acid amide hydrolase 2
MPLVRVLAGPDGADAGCVAQPLGDPTTVSIDGLTVLDVGDNGAIAVSPDLRAAQRAVAEALAARGARITPASFPALRSSFDIWSSSLAAANDTPFRELLGDGAPVRPLLELLRWPFRGSQHTLPALMLAILERLPEWTPARARRFVEAGRALRTEVIARLGSHGVLLYPSYPQPAPRHRRPLFPPFNWVYTAIFNVLELPVTQVPLGLNSDGLPLGVQVVGAPGADHVTIAVALALEEAFGGWVPPSSAAAS